MTAPESAWLDITRALTAEGVDLPFPSRRRRLTAPPVAHQTAESEPEGDPVPATGLGTADADTARLALAAAATSYVTDAELAAAVIAELPKVLDRHGQEVPSAGPATHILLHTTPRSLAVMLRRIAASVGIE